MTFARPLVLLFLAALPLWWWWRIRRPRPAAPFSDVQQLARPGRRRWLAEAPTGLRSVTLGAWIVAAAGPQLGGAFIEEVHEGIDIVLAVDVSSSMLAEDFAPANRLDVAREQTAEFIRRRRFDRIGLVTFAGEALTQVPLTVDYAVLQQAVRNMQVGTLEDGTAIGTAIAVAANRLRSAAGASRVLVLLTDGENTRGVLDPRTAAEAAGRVGVRIYTIGVGTEGEAPMPVGRSPDGRLRYQTMPVRIDEDLLRDVARTTGGRYFRVVDPGALNRVFEQIDQMEKTPAIVRRFAPVDEAYQLPLAIGLAALVLELALASTVIVRVP